MGTSIYNYKISTRSYLAGIKPISLDGGYLVSSDKTFADGAQFPGKIAKAISPHNLRQLSRLYEEISSISSPSMTPQVRMTLNIVVAEMALLDIAQKNEGLHGFATYSSEELFNDALSRLVTVSRSDVVGLRQLLNKIPSKKRISSKSNVSFQREEMSVLEENSLKILGAVAAIRASKVLPRDQAQFDFVQTEATLFRMFVASKTIPNFVLEAAYNNCVINLHLLAKNVKISRDKIPILRLFTSVNLDAPVAAPPLTDQAITVESASTAIIRGTIEAIGLTDSDQKNVLLNAAVSLDRLGVSGVQRRLDKISRMFGQERARAIIELAFLATISEYRTDGLTDLDRMLPKSFAFNYSIRGEEVERSSGGGITQIVSSGFCKKDETAIILIDQDKMPWLTNNEDVAWKNSHELEDLFVLLWVQLDLLINSKIKGVEIRVLSKNGINPDFVQFLSRFFHVSGVIPLHSSKVLTYCHEDAFDSDPIWVLRGAEIVRRSEDSSNKGKTRKASAEEIFEKVSEAILKTGVIDQDDLLFDALELAIMDLFPIDGFVDSAKEFIKMAANNFYGENSGKVVKGWLHEVISLADAAARFAAEGNPLVRVNAHPRPIDYTPLRVDHSGRITGRGAIRREEIEIEIDGVLEDGTWFETKRKMNFEWLQQAESTEQEELFGFLSQARKYAQALRERRAPALIYRLTAPYIHPNALKEIEKAFGDQAGKVTILHYTEDLDSLPTIYKLSGKTKKKKKSPSGEKGVSGWGDQDAEIWLWLANRQINSSPYKPIYPLNAKNVRRYSDVRGALRHKQLMGINSFLMGLLKGRTDPASVGLRSELLALPRGGNTLSKTLAQQIGDIARRIRSHTN